MSSARRPTWAMRYSTEKRGFSVRIISLLALAVSVTLAAPSRRKPAGVPCTGGSADAATDPWLSAGPDGTVYFSGAHLFQGSDPWLGANVSSHSLDGGRTWTPALEFSPRNAEVERAVVTADPVRPSHAYAAWFVRPSGLPFDSTLQFARTTNGGSTWSASTTIEFAAPNELNQSGEILVLPYGSLLAVFARIEIDFEQGTAIDRMFASRSSDNGLAWSSPVEAASESIQPFADPETGQALSNMDMTFHSAAIGPDGTIYVAWDRDTSPTSGTIKFVKSSDGGLTWSGPTAVPGISAFAFEPAIAVNKHRTVGLIWYDHRNDRPGDAALTTDVWFAHSKDGGSSWPQIHLAGPFDFRTLPAPTGFRRLGEYQDLDAFRNGFAAVFTQAAPSPGTARPTSSSLGSGRDDDCLPEARATATDRPVLTVCGESIEGQKRGPDPLLSRLLDGCGVPRSGARRPEARLGRGGSRSRKQRVCGPTTLVANRF